MPQSSLYLDILNAVKTAVDALSLTDWNDKSVPSIVRKMAAYRQVVDAAVAPPAIYISPNHKGERVDPRVFGDTVWVVYSVDIFTIAGGNQDLTARMDYYLKWRQLIRQEFQSSKLSGVSAVWDTHMKPASNLDPSAISKNYDVLLLTVEFTTAEQRLTT